MCGFVTIVNRPGHRTSAATLKRMTALLAHRGPDDVGYACADPGGGPCRTWGDELEHDEPLPGVVFGHRRLSILDPTPAGRQPMLSDDGSIALCYNGEAYNFIELRERLAASGATFHGRGDTEVLLRAYEQWGAAAVERLNGMWAFAIWDGRRGEAVVSRDRFGVKPLYYAVVDGTWVFASEIKALLAYPGAFRGYEDGRVMEFLGAAVVDQDSGTMFNGVRSVPPASYVRLAPGAAESDVGPQTFWRLRVDPSRGGRPECELVEEFASLLDDAVRLRVRSDVPIGTMLSGGLDSTAITLLIHEQRRREAASAGAAPESAGLRCFHHTFTACWPGWKNDEAADADLVCERLGLTSHKLCPTGETMGEALERVVYHLDEPFENPTAIVQYLLMRAARERGVKVVLNGGGADETLAGYAARFVPPFLAGLLAGGRLLAFAREHRAFQAGGEWRGGDVRRAILDVILPAALKPGLHRLRQATRHRPASRDVLAGPRENDRADPPISNGSPPLSPLNGSLWQTFTRTVLPMWLRMEDRMSMAWGVESRLPFMDYRLVEFAFGLPDGMKLNDGYTKYILRRALWDRLPERIVRNRVKRRFAAPYHGWLRTTWRPLIEDLFLTGSCRVEPYLRLPEFRSRLSAYLNRGGRSLDSALLWRILNTELWLRAFSGTPVARAPRSRRGF